MPKKLKGKHIYELSRPYIRSLFIHDLRSAICKHNKRFSEVFHKSEELVLQQTITPEILEELLEYCNKRIDQARYIFDRGLSIGYNEIDVIGCYSDLYQKITELINEKNV